MRDLVRDLLLGPSSCASLPRQRQITQLLWRRYVAVDFAPDADADYDLGALAKPREAASVAEARAAQQAGPAPVPLADCIQVRLSLLQHHFMPFTSDRPVSLFNLSSTPSWLVHRPWLHLCHSLSPAAPAETDLAGPVALGAHRCSVGHCVCSATHPSVRPC